MEKNKKILVVAAALLAVLIIVAVVVRRRGRKVYLKPEYRLNNNHVIYIVPADGRDGSFYQGNLDYVIVPFNAENIDLDGQKFIQVSGAGQMLPDGRIVRVRLKGKNYIQTNVLDL